MHTPHAVVAGFDGSPDGRAAVEYAAAAAYDLGLPLRVIHCYAWSEAQTAIFHAAGRMLADLCETLEPHYPALDFQPMVLSRSPAAALVGESKTAEMIVVGRLGMGTFGGLHTGAVSRQVVSQSSCPAIVTSSPDVPNGPVFISVGTSDEAYGHDAEGHHGMRTEERLDADSATKITSDAVKFAFVEAARREVALYAIHVAADLGLGAASGLAEEQRDEEFDSLLAEWHNRYPTVEVHGSHIVRKAAAQHLLEATRDAGLVVVGGFGSIHGGRTIRLGELPSALFSSATCPVAVIDMPT